jgi:5'-methylthioadenosine phosphorylase
MARLAVILGSSALGAQGPDLSATVESRGAIALQRHGAERFRLPHAIDHASNLRRLRDSGCERVLAIGSVGSLDPELAIGSLVCPHDFIALQVALTTYEDARGHSMPGFDDEWRRELIAAWQRRLPETLRAGGVYWQTNGPRFETPAEIRLLAAHADLVGMTIASECIVARELGLAYAAVCVVDNLANGIGPAPLSTLEIEEARRVNAERLAEALEAVLPELAG